MSITETPRPLADAPGRRSNWKVWAAGALALLLVALGLLAMLQFRATASDRGIDLAIKQIRQLEAQRAEDIDEVNALEANKPEPPTPSDGERQAARAALTAADKAVDTAIARWMTGSSKMSTVVNAIGACQVAVDKVNTLALGAQDPEQEKVDPSASGSDCGAVEINKVKNS